MNWTERKRRNDEAKLRAEHDRQPWTTTEEEILLGWDRTEPELADLAELFGRTTEACRQHFYVLRQEGNKPRSPRKATREHASQPQSSGRSARTSPLRDTLSMAGWSEEDRAEWSWLEGQS